MRVDTIDNLPSNAFVRLREESPALTLWLAHVLDAELGLNGDSIEYPFVTEGVEQYLLGDDDELGVSDMYKVDPKLAVGFGLKRYLKSLADNDRTRQAEEGPDSYQQVYYVNLLPMNVQYQVIERELAAAYTTQNAVGSLAVVRMIDSDALPGMPPRGHARTMTATMPMQHIVRGYKRTIGIGTLDPRLMKLRQAKR